MQTGTTLASILSDIQTVLTSVISWVSSVVQAIVDNPLLLLFVITSFIFLSVALIRRMIRL